MTEDYRIAARRNEPMPSLDDSRRVELADRGRGRRFVLAIACLAVTALMLAPAAHGSDRIYWANLINNTISYANLDGSGGGDLPINPATLDGPMGLAIDTKQGTIYWSNLGSSEAGTTISVANLDGSNAHVVPISGVGVSGPHGVAVDSVAGKLYWTNHDANSGASWIGYANLDGSQGGLLNTGNANMDGPRGLALDRQSGKLYFANWLANTISFARLDGSGGADIPTNGATVDNPEGVALSPSQNRLYYGNFVFNPSPPQETISYVNLDGTGGGDLTTGAATRDEPHGVAIDPSAGRIYWPNFAADVISYASLDGTSGADLPTGGATKDGPNLPVLLKAPAPTGHPAVNGSAKPKAKLHCGIGSWAADQNASQLYQAPTTYTYVWKRNGKEIPGRTSGKLKVHSIGDYRCLVGGRNAAGAGFEESLVHAAFKLGRLKWKPATGTGLLKVKLPGPGRLKLKGKGVAKHRVADGTGSVRALARKVKKRGTVKLRIKPRGKVKRRLRHSGRAKLKLKVAYRPRGGTVGVQKRVVHLRER